MTFLFDDDVPDDLSHLLKHVGHRVTFLREVLPRDTPDAAVLDHAVQHGLILVTHPPEDRPAHLFGHPGVDRRVRPLSIPFEIARRAES